MDLIKIQNPDGRLIQTYDCKVMNIDKGVIRFEWLGHIVSITAKQYKVRLENNHWEVWVYE